MRQRQSPRFAGKITQWKDDQGFGFITPNGGGAAVFVHVKAFGRQDARPAEGDLVNYELGANEKGQARAINVALVRGPASRATRSTTRSTPRSTSRGHSVLAAAGFLGMLALLAMAGWVPLLVFVLYFAMSGIAFVAYAIDKAAARSERRRTPENTLHLLGLAGGWPGALVAQALLRHKSAKRSFQVAYWWTVAINCAALFWYLTPAGRRTVHALLGLDAG
ncbi:MAG: DUF1294 domain-containing protein [Lysobacteraceae bacterium]|nr:MAG: DUF1294 domain-containing protein [Xanthomonadaceae bacterium]